MVVDPGKRSCPPEQSNDAAAKGKLIAFFSADKWKGLQDHGSGQGSGLLQPFPGNRDNPEIAHTFRDGAPTQESKARWLDAAKKTTRSPRGKVIDKMKISANVLETRLAQGVYRSFATQSPPQRGSNPIINITNEVATISGTVPGQHHLERCQPRLFQGSILPEKWILI